MPIGVQLLEVEGPMARRVADLQAAYRVLVGPTWRDRWTVPAPLNGPEPVAEPLGTERRQLLADNLSAKLGQARRAGVALAHPIRLARAAGTTTTPAAGHGGLPGRIPVLARVESVRRRLPVRA